jgi:outer membrane lipoprotein-sorting protein
LKPLLYLALALCIAADVAPTSAPSPSPSTAPAVDPDLARQMQPMDEKVGQIVDLRADFEQRKYTALLKKPLISSGTVAAKGARSLWTTSKPEPSLMSIDGQEIRLYYPKQAAMEIYPIMGRLGSLASSPLPRLSVLREFFAFAQIPASDLDPKADNTHDLALRLTPIDPSLREHIQQVRVLVDRQTGLVLLAETVDADDDRTVLIFSNVRTNTGLTDKELTIDVPANTNISRPFEGMGSPPPPPSRQGRKP